MAYSRRDIAKTCGAASVGTSSAVIAPLNVNRISILVKNNSGADVYLKLQTNAASNAAAPTATVDSASVKLASGESFSTTDYQGPIAAIAGSAVQVTVLEI